MKAFPSTPSIALVYDRVNTSHGGAEKVLLALHQLFPKAPLYTAFYAPHKARWAKPFRVFTSWLNTIPFFSLLHRWLAIFAPAIFESFDLSQYDIVISVTSAEAKGVITYPHQLHICYLLTPTRYLYHEREHSLDSHWLLRLPIIRQTALLGLAYIRWWDQAAIFRPDVIIPISKRVGQRVRHFYAGVEPTAPIYPPVEPHNQQQSSPFLYPGFTQDKPYLLAISRLVSHKRLELAIHACAKLDKKLIIVGTGPAKQSLRQLARSLQAPVLFLDSVSDQQLANLYEHCQAVIMPGEEDFGIVALEAHGFGKPVIINQHSGAAELITSGVHGTLIKKATVPDTIKAIQQLEKKSFSASKIRQNPVKYSTQAFLKNFDTAVQSLWKEHQAH